MKYLEPPDTHFLTAAVGWLELGNVAEANAELDQVPPGLQQHPDVLEVRWLICCEQEQWTEGLELARKLVSVAPDRASGWLHQSYALRRVEMGGVKQAWDALLPAFSLFPEEPTISYNLSCYACLMKELETARLWLKRATTAGGKAHIKQMALQDPDLEALWPEIKKL